MRDPNFSLYEFKKWLDNKKGSEDGTCHNMIRKSSRSINESRKGTYVVSRLGIERLTEKIKHHNETDTGTAKRLAEIFKKYGGTIIKCEDLDVLIKLEGDDFTLPKAYVKNG